MACERKDRDREIQRMEREETRLNWIHNNNNIIIITLLTCQKL